MSPSFEPSKWITLGTSSSATTPTSPASSSSRCWSTSYQHLLLVLTMATTTLVRRRLLPIPSLSLATLAAAVPTAPMTIPPPSLPTRAATHLPPLLLVDGTPPPATITFERPADPGRPASRTLGTCHTLPMAPRSGVGQPRTVSSSLLLGKRVWTDTGGRKPNGPREPGKTTASSGFTGCAKTSSFFSSSADRSTKTCAWNGGNDTAVFGSCRGDRSSGW